MDPFSFDIDAARQALEEHGIAATGSLGLNESTDISSEDPDAVRAGEALLTRAVDVLAALGSEHLCGIIYSAMRKYMEPATEVGVRNSQHVLAPGSRQREPTSASRSVSVEVSNRYESNVLNTAQQARAFGERCGADSPRRTWTPNTWSIEEADMFSPGIDTAALLRYVHIGESHRGYLGSGGVDFDSFFRALNRDLLRRPGRVRGRPQRSSHQT